MAARPNLSMAERLSANMKIMAQCKRAYPDLDKTEYSKMARELESEIYEQCTSNDDYQHLVETMLEKLRQQQIPEQPLEPAPDPYSPPDDTLLEQIGPYRACYHANGLFSTVYRSQTPSGTIAIKLTTPSVMQQPHNSHREARLLKLAAHDSIIPILSSQSISGGHYIITMPFLPYDFGSLLDNHSLTKPQIKSHLYSLFSALAHVHSLDIIHRDIKPSNLLLASASGPAYLSDLGISWHALDPDSEPADDKITDIGTTHYRAPELQFGNISYGEEVDLWAAGCVVAEALNNGEALFDSGDVGSEIALIRSIFGLLGTPSDEGWPEAKGFRDWGKVTFREFPAKTWEEILPGVDGEGRDLVSNLVVYESGKRLRAREVLRHSYFQDIHSSS